MKYSEIPRWIEKKPIHFLIIGILIFLFMLYQTSFLKTQIEMKDMLPKENKEIKTYLSLLEDFRNTRCFSLYCDLRKETVESCSLFEDYLRKTKDIYYVFGFPDVVKKMGFKNLKEALMHFSPKELLVSKDLSLGFISACYRGDSLVSFDKKQELMKEIEKIKEKGFFVSLGGEDLLSEKSKENMSITMRNTSLLSFILIFIILFLFFKRVDYVLLSFIPILFSTISTMGTLAFLGFSFNQMTSAVFSLIVGLGIDYSIHVIFAFEKKKKADYVFSHSGKAILLGALTSIFAFLTFLLGELKFLRSLSVSLALGIFYSYFAAMFILLPALIVIKRFKKRK